MPVPWSACDELGSAHLRKQSAAPAVIERCRLYCRVETEQVAPSAPHELVIEPVAHIALHDGWVEHTLIPVDSRNRVREPEPAKWPLSNYNQC